MSSNAGREGGCGVSANEYSCTHGAQINLGDLTPYLTYDSQLVVSTIFIHRLFLLDDLWVFDSHLSQRLKSSIYVEDFKTITAFDLDLGRPRNSSCFLRAGRSLWK
jgi:hypothetical protein